MPRYLVSTLNVQEVIEAGSPEEAEAHSSFASEHDLAYAVLVDEAPLVIEPLVAPELIEAAVERGQSDDVA